MAQKHPIAVSTMVYDDVDCLQIWLSYWRAKLDPAHLYVIIDGPNPTLEAMAEGCNVIVRDRPEPHENMETDRWTMLEGFVADLLDRYETAIYTDVDEIIVADPKTGRSVTELIAAEGAAVRHTRGLELLHLKSQAPDPIDLSRPILRQRQFYRATGRFSKPCIVRQPVSWGRGGHLSSFGEMHFADGLYTVHLRFYDVDQFLDRARRRRETTKAPAHFDSQAYRKWRSSEADAKILIESFEKKPRMPVRSLLTQRITNRMQRTFSAAPDERGLHTYVQGDGRVTQRLPQRFLDLF